MEGRRNRLLPFTSLRFKPALLSIRLQKVFEGQGERLTIFHPWHHAIPKYYQGAPGNPWPKQHIRAHTTIWMDEDC